MSNIKVLIIGILITILLVFGVRIFQRQEESKTSFPVVSNTPPPRQDQRSDNIIVTSPHPHETLPLPIIITGKARVFENQFNYRLRDGKNLVLSEGTAYANSPDTGLFGNYTIVMNTIAKPETKEGILELFDYSAKDGSEINMVTIPFVFSFSETTTVSLFFGTKQSSDCTSVSPVERITVKTITPARVAIEELLKGPTTSEKTKGYETSINPGVVIQKLTIQNGTAYIDLNKKLDDGVAGSCRVLAIRAEIIKTLQQFPTVKNVIISVDGRTEDILQP